MIALYVGLLSVSKLESIGMKENMLIALYVGLLSVSLLTTAHSDKGEEDCPLYRAYFSFPSFGISHN